MIPDVNNIQPSKRGFTSLLCDHLVDVTCFTEDRAVVDDEAAMSVHRPLPPLPSHESSLAFNSSD